MLLTLLTVLAVLAVLFFLAGIAAAPARRLAGDAGDVAVLTAEQITDLAERSKDLALNCIAAVTKVSELRSKKAEERGETFTADMRSAIDDLHAQDAMHAAVTRILRDDADERQRAEDATRGRGPQAGTGAHTGDGPELRSAGQQLVDHEGYADFAANGARGTFEAEVRTLLTTATDAGAGPAAGLFVPTNNPQLAPGAVERRRLFVRDLLSTGTSGLPSFAYLQERNSAANAGGAAMVAQAAAKPEVAMEFVAQRANAEKIAAWIPVTTEILADAPTLRSYIDARLAYMLDIREEDQVLNGNGTTPNLLGIRQATGLQTVKPAGGTATPTAGDRLTTLATGIRLVEEVDGDADGAAMTPTDFWAMATRRATGDNHYDVNPFASPDSLRPWGLPTVRTRSLPNGTAIVAAWRLGATLLDREQTRIRVGEQHADFFTNNKVAILAEKRVLLPIHKPPLFVEITFA